MSEPTVCAAACCRSTRASSAADGYCVYCDLLVGLPALHVVAVKGVQGRRGETLLVSVESAAAVMGCPRCGVVARSHGRRIVELIDTPCFGRPVRLRWRKRTWTCPDPARQVGDLHRAEPAGRPRPGAADHTRVTVGHGQLCREHASVQGLARRLGTTWRTVRRAI